MVRVIPKKIKASTISLQDKAKAFSGRASELGVQLVPALEDYAGGRLLFTWAFTEQDSSPAGFEPLLAEVFNFLQEDFSVVPTARGIVQEYNSKTLYCFISYTSHCIFIEVR